MNILNLDLRGVPLQKILRGKFIRRTIKIRPFFQWY